MSEVGCGISDVGCGISDFGCWISDFGFRISDFGGGMLVSSFLQHLNPGSRLFILN